MTKKLQATHPIRRINLSLPIIQNNAYEIYQSMLTTASRQTATTHPHTQKKPLIDCNIHNHTINSTNNSTKLNQPVTITRSPHRFKHKNGRVLINLFVEMPVVPTDSLSTIADTISNALMKSGFSLETIQNVRATVAEENHCESINNSDENNHEDDNNTQTQPTTPDKLLYESIETLEGIQANKMKFNAWQNIHLPPLATTKVSHSQKTFKRASYSNDKPLKGVSLGTLGKAAPESIVLPNDCLHNKIDKLTKNYFPAIQQLRHTYPEVGYTRMYSNRQEKRDFLPGITRSRVVR